MEHVYIVNKDDYLDIGNDIMISLQCPLFFGKIQLWLDLQTKKSKLLSIGFQSDGFRSDGMFPSALSVC